MISSRQVSRMRYNSILSNVLVHTRASDIGLVWFLGYLQFLCF